MRGILSLLIECVGEEDGIFFDSGLAELIFYGVDKSELSSKHLLSARMF